MFALWRVLQISVLSSTCHLGKCLLQRVMSKIASICPYMSLSKHSSPLCACTIPGQGRVRAQVACEVSSCARGGRFLGPVGRNVLEGHDTQRVYSLLTKTRVYDRLIEHRLCWRCSTAC